MTLTAMPLYAAAADGAADQKTEASLPEVKVQGNKDAGYSTMFSTSATKSNAPLRDVPQTVNIVPQQLIRDQGARSMQDVLRNVPGVGMSSGDGQRDQVTIRGFTAIADQFIDGIRDDALYFRDLSNIERVEVLKGPAAVLYGRGSSGGLINRVTKKPQAGAFGEVTMNFGSNDLKRTSFDANTSVNEHINLRVTGAYEDSGSYRDQGFVERSSIAPAVSIRFTEDTRLLMQGEFAKDKRITDFGIPSFDGRPVDVPRSTYYGSGNARRDDTTATEVSSLAVVFDHRFNDALSVRNATRYYDYDLDRNNTLPGGTVDTATLTVGRNRGEIGRQEHGYFNQTDFTFKNALGGLKQEWLFGLEVGRQTKDAQFANQSNIDRVSIFNPGGKVAPPISAAVLNGDAAIPTSSVFKVLGVYAQDQIALTPEWKALLGIRYDSFKQDTEFERKFAPLARTDKNWSPRAGLIWQPSESASYYVSYSKSYQPSGESFALAANNAVNGPEQTENREIGTKLDFLEGAFSVTGALFNLVRSDIKTIDPAKPSVLINVGEQRTNGLELTANGRLPQGWDISTGYAYLDGRITESNSKQASPQTPVVQISLEGNRPSLTPRHSAFVWAVKQLGGGFSAGGGLNYSADRFASPSNAVVLPGFLTADLAAYYRSKPYDVAINLKNVTDKKYIVSAHGSNDNLIVPGAPREIQVTLTYKF
ncbi:MAG TPA: TonB-dependent siderophore receptor [Novimethylophilus sp.]|uniref:TonB-dependent receptor n=1 Tax=Novimethylophilus sp. TaxID=2137426 RepID=UPI002F3E2091